MDPVLAGYQPAYRKQVEAELQEQLAGSSDPLSVEAARNLHRLDLFIREAGRLHSPVQSVPRGVVTDTEFAGYTLQLRPSSISIAGCTGCPAILRSSYISPPIHSCHLARKIGALHTRSSHLEVGHASVLA